MNKPTVHYKQLVSCREGESALVIGVSDHPNHLPGHKVSNTPDKPVWTSEVKSYDEATGRFETRNTIYERAAA